MTLGRLRVVSDSSAVIYDTNGYLNAAGSLSSYAPRYSTPISAQYITVRADAGVDYSLEP